MKLFVLSERPAVLLEDRGRAYVLPAPQPAGLWIPTDPVELQRLGRPLAEEWRAHFEPTYGRITLANPQPPRNAYQALAMGRTLKAVGEKYEDPDNVATGEALEDRALAAIRAGKDVLDPLN